MRSLLMGFVVLGLVFVVGSALTPGSVTEANRAAAEKEKRVEEARFAERDAHNKRVAECLPAGADSLDPKLFSAMLDDCEREVLIQESREAAVDAGLKEKWNAPPLYEEVEG